jgi:transposase
MLTLPSNVKIYVATQPADFRKSFDGLAAIVENAFGISAHSGHVFVFLNKRANQVRLLFWERDGLCLVAKRLEVGTFRRIMAADGAITHMQIDAAELLLLLEGIDVSSMRRRTRYVSPEKNDTSDEKNCVD